MQHYCRNCKEMTVISQLNRLFIQYCFANGPLVKINSQRVIRSVDLKLDNYPTCKLIGLRKIKH